MTEFNIPASAGESELTEKRSRFLGHLRPVESEDEAKAFIQQIRKQYHDARHNCWCYRIYDGPERFSDDGEPQGSAGMPMLEVFRRENVSNLVCVVTRYFGGVLLGTGGLSRAYSAAAKDALLAAGTRCTSEWAEIVFSCPYSLTERLKKLLLSEGAVLGDLIYDADVRFLVRVPFPEAEALAGKITDLSGGKITPEISGPILM